MRDTEVSRAIAAVGNLPAKSVAPLPRRRGLWNLRAVCEAGLGVAALLYFPLLVMVPRGIAPLITIGALLGVGLVFGRSPRAALPCIWSIPAALLAAIVVWGLLSAAWSPNPARSLIQAGRLAGLIAAPLAIAAADFAVTPRRIMWLLLAGCVAALALATLDIAAHGALSRPIFADRVYQPAWLNQGADGFAILVLPIGAALWSCGFRLPAVLFVGAAAGTVFFLAGTAAKAALAPGVAVALLS